ncbi:MAG: L,D-transpeptidase family protein [Chthoniobacterales bacterium]
MRIPSVSILLAGAALFLAGCQSYDSRLASRETEYLNGQVSVHKPAAAGGGYDPVSYWDGDNVSGSPSVKIFLSEQRAYFYKGDQLVGVSQISSGREGHNTPTGTYKIVQKDPDHASNLYGDFVDDAGNVVKANVAISDPKPPGSHFKGAPMPHFMRITGGVGMHAGFLPGYPASHGCIRMPAFMADTFYSNVSLGTPVELHH